MNVSFVFSFICAFNESFWVIVRAHLEVSRLAVLLAEAISSIFSTFFHYATSCVELENIN